jgi:hypothetical protein
VLYLNILKIDRASVVISGDGQTTFESAARGSSPAGASGAWASGGAPEMAWKPTGGESRSPGAKS